MEAFVTSIRRILRPNGIFILREHDAKDDKTYAQVLAAHSVFNALADNIPLASERAEIREFKPLDEYIESIEKQGFKMLDKDGLIQAGDPTLNTLVGFTVNEERKRSLHQTFLTTLEWYNVFVAEQFAKFLEDKKPLESFPFDEIAEVANQLTEASHAAAVRHIGQAALEASPRYREYKSMNDQMAYAMVQENWYRKLLGYGPSTENDWGDDPPVLARVMRKYADFIQHTPFYNYSYGEDAWTLWKSVFSPSSDNRWRDLYIALVMSGEYLAKAGAASWVRWDQWWNDAPVEDRNIDAVAKAPAETLKAIDQRIQVLDDTRKDGETLFRMPRYMPFKEIIIKLANENIALTRIAGNSIIAIMVFGPNDSIDNLKEGSLWDFEYYCALSSFLDQGSYILRQEP